MYLHRLYIKNFRSINELDLNFSKGKNVIVGRNNTGKSNIIKAIDLLLGVNSPTYHKSDNITDTDFYSWKELDDDNNTSIHTTDEISIWCELKRDNDDLLNYDEIYKCFGFYVHSEIVDWIDRRPIKEPIRISNVELPQIFNKIFELNEDESSEKEYINPKNRYQSVLEKEFDDMYHFAFAFRALKDADNNITKEIRFLYREGDSHDWILAFKAQIRNELLQSAIIPSFRDPQNQLRLTNWTWFGKLMKHLTSNNNHVSEIKTAFDGVKNVADTIFSDLKTNIENSTIDVAFPGTELHFQFNVDTRLDLYKNCSIYIDDGFKSQLVDKGSGIQSATIIGLFNYYTKYINTITSSLLCVEEPEIYLHPHARRVLRDRLDDFLDDNKNQVIISTHSVDFIKTVSDINIILVKKGDKGTEAEPVKINEFKNILIDDNQNELFFADKVIVCEGFDYFILRAVANELFPKKLDEQNVSIISIGGKDRINQLVTLILKLGIECFIFTDFDYILRDKHEERNQYGAKAHENILNIDSNFFTQPCIFGTDGTDIISKIQTLRTYIKSNYEEKFYTVKKAEDIPYPEINEIIRKLRKKGIGILSGDIENCCVDPTFISSEKKLNLKKVYELNARLVEGTNISDLFNTNEIEEFLDAVFD